MIVVGCDCRGMPIRVNTASIILPCSATVLQPEKSINDATGLVEVDLAAQSRTLMVAVRSLLTY